MTLPERLAAFERLAAGYMGSRWKVSSYRPRQIIQRDPDESTYAVGDDKFIPLADVDNPKVAAFIASLPDLLKLAQDQDARVRVLEREVEVLRHYGNKDCTHMADKALANGEPTK